MDQEAGQSGQQSWWREDDVIVSRWVGACTMAELEAFFRFAEPILRVLPRPFLMIDNTRAQPARPEVRRQLVEWARAHRVGGGVVIFGADLPTRTIGMLLINALGLLSHSDLAKRVQFVRDEAAARAWIAGRRRPAQPAQPAL